MATKYADSQVNRPAVEQAIQDLIRGLGEDPEREGLRDTPKRVALMYEEILAGRKGEVKITAFAEEAYDEMIVLKDIPFYSLCEHHLLPFFGKASVAYIPRKNLLGISKLARYVEKYARRLQVQERMTTQIAKAIQREVNPRGIGVVVSAEHLCMTMRGAKKPGVLTVTSCLTGSFKKPATRAEFLGFLGGSYGY